LLLIGLSSARSGLPAAAGIRLAVAGPLFALWGIALPGFVQSKSVVNSHRRVRLDRSVSSALGRNHPVARPATREKCRELQKNT
jgi:hypothetical protein